MTFDGAWQCQLDTPMGKQTAQMVFSTVGDALHGSMHTTAGDTEVRDGLVTADGARWKCSVTRPMPLTLEFAAQVENDVINGVVKLGAFGTASFSGTRV